MITGATTGQFTVWHRSGPRRPWARVGEAPSESAAWALALAEGKGGDWLVQRPGQPDPNERRRSAR